MTAPNIVNVATITGKTAVQAVTTSATAIVTAASNTAVKVNTLQVTNLTAAPVAITVDLYRSSTAYRSAYQISVPANAALVLVSKDNPVWLEESDALRLTAGANSSLEAVASYEIIL